MAVAKAVRGSGRRSSAIEPPGRGSLDGFEARLRPATGLCWPRGERLAWAEAIELGPADSDLLILNHVRPAAAARRAERENLMIELGRALGDCRTGVLSMRRLVYRAGGDRLSYQATRATGSLALIACTAELFVLSAALTLIAPDLDLDGAGPRLLAGTVHLART
jgi:hypothetical protein